MRRDRLRQRQDGRPHHILAPGRLRQNRCGRSRLVVVKPDSQWKLATILLPGSIPVSEEDK